MAKCFTFKGKRLENMQICLFDSPPVRYDKNTPRAGIMDTCHKMRFPAPRDCQPLHAQQDILGEFPFDLVVGRTYYQYMTPPAVNYDTAALAWAAIMWDSPQVTQRPDQNFFQLEFVGQLTETLLHKFWFLWTTSSNRFYFPLGQLAPSWRADSSVEFFLAWEQPEPSGVSENFGLMFNGDFFPFNVGHVEFAVDKELFYGEAFGAELSIGTIPFAYADYLTLPPFGVYGRKGFNLYDDAALNLRLIVRRTLQTFKACWDKDVYNAAFAAAVIDPRTGLVVGPYLPTGRRRDYEGIG